DYDDEDYAPRRREQKGSKTGLIIGLVVGGLLLIGGGVTTIIILSSGKQKTPEEQLAEEMGKAFEQLGNDNPFGANPFKDNPFQDNPFKDKGNVFKDNLFKDAPIRTDDAKPQKALTFADHLKNLQSGDDRAKSQAVSFFQNADPSAPERAEVAKALETHA